MVPLIKLSLVIMLICVMANVSAFADLDKSSLQDRNEIETRMFYIGIVQSLLFLLQLLAFSLQARRLNKTVTEMKNATQITEKLVSAAQNQANGVNSYVLQAARSADAMEGVAQSIASSVLAAMESVETSHKIAEQQQFFSQAQMRAYLSVNVAGAAYQDEKLRFEGRPILINTGHTPARNLRYWAHAEIMPWPLDKNFTFPSHAEPNNYTSSLNPGQSFILNAMVQNRIEDKEVENVKHGNGTEGKRLCVWGQVDYEDIFGNPFYVKFSHGMNWIGQGKDEKITGYYSNNHNDSN